MTTNPMVPPDPSSPALKPPPGVTPNFNDAFTLEPYNIITIALCTALSTIMVLARLYTKVHIVKKLLWEDYASFIGYIGFIGTVIIQIKVGEHGAGTHQWNLPYSGVVYARQWTNYGDTVYSVACLFTKYSILWLIKRVFLRVRYDIFYWIIQFLIVANTIFYILFLFIPIWACIPRAKIWHPDLPGRCLNFTALLMSSAAWNTFSDTAMLAVPLFMIWRLQLTWRRKVAAFLVFSTAGLACATSIIRIPYLTILIDEPDYTYHKLKGVMWATAEIALGITCSCLPILPRFIQHVWNVSVPSESETMMDMANGKNSATKGQTKERKRDWVELKETTKPSTPQQTHAPFQGNVPTHREDIEMGVRG